MHPDDLSITPDFQKHLRVPIEVFSYIVRLVRDAGGELSQICTLCQVLQIEVQRVLYEDVLIYIHPNRNISWYQQSSSIAISDNQVSKRLPFLKSISCYIHSVVVVGRYKEDVKEWLNMMPNLQSLALWLQRFPDDHREAKIGSNIQGLRHFSTNLVVSGDSTLSQMLCSNPHLQSLSFSVGSLKLPITVRKEYVENIRSLSYHTPLLDASLSDQCNWLRALLTLAALAPNIKNINFDGCFYSSDLAPHLSVLKEYLPRLPNLTNFSAMCDVLWVEGSHDILAIVSANQPALTYFGVHILTAYSSKEYLDDIEPHVMRSLEKSQYLETIAFNVVYKKAGMETLDRTLNQIRSACKRFRRAIVIFGDDEVLGEWIWLNSQWQFRRRLGEITPGDLWDQETRWRR